MAPVFQDFWQDAARAVMRGIINVAQRCSEALKYRPSVGQIGLPDNVAVLVRCPTSHGAPLLAGQTDLTHDVGHYLRDLV